MKISDTQASNDKPKCRIHERRELAAFISNPPSEVHTIRIQSSYLCEGYCFWAAETSLARPPIPEVKLWCMSSIRTERCSHCLQNYRSTWPTVWYNAAFSSQVLHCLAARAASYRGGRGIHLFSVTNATQTPLPQKS